MGDELQPLPQFAWLPGPGHQHEAVQQPFAFVCVCVFFVGAPMMVGFEGNQKENRPPPPPFWLVVNKSSPRQRLRSHCFGPPPFWLVVEWGSPRRKHQSRLLAPPPKKKKMRRHPQSLIEPDLRHLAGHPRLLQDLNGLHALG